MRKVGFDAGPFGPGGDFIEQPAAHVDQGAGAAWGHVESPEKFLAGRLDRVLQGDEIGLGGLVAISARAAFDLFRIRRELLHQKVEEDAKPFRVEGAISGQGVLGQTRPRHLTALGQQRMAERDHPSGQASAGARLRVPPVGSGAEKALEIE